MLRKQCLHTLHRQLDTHLALRGFAAMLLTIALGACGQQQETDAAAASAAAAAKAARDKQAAVPQDTFVKATLITVGNVPHELHFELPAPPVLHQPFVLNLRLTGLADTTSVETKFAGSEQIKIADNAAWRLETLPAGRAEAHSLSLSVDEPGVYVLDVAVQSTREAYTKTFTYAVPVIVTSGADTSAAASGQASGK